MITGRLLDLEYVVDVPESVEAYVREALTDSLGHVSDPTPFRLHDDGGEWVIQVGSDERLRSVVASHALAHFFWELHQTAVRSVAAPMIHAAALEAPNGRGVLIVGPSGAGKTTSTITLLRAGFRYVTDDAVVLDGGPRVRGMAKSLGIRAGTRDLLSLRLADLARPAAPFFDEEAIQVPASRFGSTIAGTVADLIVVLDPDASPDDGPVRIPAAVAAVELLQQGFEPAVLNPNQFDGVVELTRAASSVRTARLPIDRLAVTMTSLLDTL